MRPAVTPDGGVAAPPTAGVRTLVRSDPPAALVAPTSVAEPEPAPRRNAPSRRAPRHGSKEARGSSSPVADAPAAATKAQQPAAGPDFTRVAGASSRAEGTRDAVSPAKAQQEGRWAPGEGAGSNALWPRGREAGALPEPSGRGTRAPAKARGRGAATDQQPRNHQKLNKPKQRQKQQKRWLDVGKAPKSGAQQQRIPGGDEYEGEAGETAAGACGSTALGRNDLNLKRPPLEGTAEAPHGGKRRRRMEEREQQHEAWKDGWWGGGKTTAAHAVGEADGSYHSGCGEYQRTEGEGEGEEAAAHSCSGSLAANSGSASISGAASGSLSLGLVGANHQKAKAAAEHQPGSQAGPGPRDSIIRGVTDKVSASRPASCGESFVEVAEPIASQAKQKRSVPAASATGPAGPEGTAASSGATSGKRRAIGHHRHKGLIPRIQQSAANREWPGASGEGHSCPSDQPGPSNQGGSWEEHLSLFLRLKELPSDSLHRFTGNLIFRRFKDLHAGKVDLELLSAVQTPAALTAPSKPAATLGRLLEAASQDSFSLPSGVSKRFTLSSHRSSGVLPQPSGTVVRTERFVAAQMDEEARAGGEGEGEGAAEAGPGAGPRQMHLTRLDLPVPGSDAPASVRCSCARGEDPPFMWCRHVAGLAVAFSSQQPGPDSQPAPPLLNCPTLCSAMGQEEPVSLAEMLYVLAASDTTSGCNLAWLSALVPQLGKGQPVEACGPIPQEATSAVGDPHCPEGNVVGSKAQMYLWTYEHVLQDEALSMDELVEAAERLERQPAAHAEELLSSMGRGKADELTGSELKQDTTTAPTAKEFGTKMAPAWTNWEEHTPELLQKVWSLVETGDAGYAWELLCELTAAASHSACWQRLLKALQGAVIHRTAPPLDRSKQADTSGRLEQDSGARKPTLNPASQAMGFPGQEQDTLLAELDAVWEGCTSPAQRALFFAPLWDGGVPTGRAAANAAASPGWQRGVFSPHPHVGLVSLVGSVVGLVPGVLSGMSAAEVLQMKCTKDSMARHLGLLVALGEQKTSEGAAAAMAGAAAAGLAPNVPELHSLMEDLRLVSAMLSAHAVWEQQVGLWDDSPQTLAVNASGSCSSSKIGSEVEDPEVSSQRAARRAAALQHQQQELAQLGALNNNNNNPSRPSNSSTATTALLSGSAGAPAALLAAAGMAAPQQASPPPVPNPRPFPEPQQRPGPGPGASPSHPRGAPALLWISAAAVARGMAVHSPADRLRVLATLVPPPTSANSGWRGQAALITCLAASTAATANMFLMGMMAIHHLSNVFTGEGAGQLSQLKLGCATLLAFAPDEASALAGCYFMELCVTIAAGSPPSGPSAPAAPPPPPGLSKESVVDHALATLLTMLEREGAPMGRADVTLGILQTLWRLLRRPGLPFLGRHLSQQASRWIRALVGAAHAQRVGGRLQLLVVVKAMEALWGLISRCQGEPAVPTGAGLGPAGASAGSRPGSARQSSDSMGARSAVTSQLEAALSEAGPMLVASVSRLLGFVLQVLEAPRARAHLPGNNAVPDRPEKDAWMEPSWVWPEGATPEAGHAMDPLMLLTDSTSFATEAAVRAVVAMSYRPGMDGTGQRLPAFERALLAPLLGALLAEPSAGVRVRLAACSLLGAMTTREYQATCGTLMSAPGVVSALLDALDGQRSASAARPQPAEAQNFEDGLKSARGDKDSSDPSEEQVLGQALEVKALQTLWRLFESNSGAQAGAQAGDPQQQASQQQAQPQQPQGGQGGAHLAQPSQQLWKKVARHRVIRRFMRVLERCLARAEAPEASDSTRPGGDGGGGGCEGQDLRRLVLPTQEVKKSLGHPRPKRAPPGWNSIPLAQQQQRQHQTQPQQQQPQQVAASGGAASTGDAPNDLTCGTNDLLTGVTPPRHLSRGTCTGGTETATGTGTQTATGTGTQTALGHEYGTPTGCYHLSAAMANDGHVVGGLARAILPSPSPFETLYWTLLLTEVLVRHKPGLLDELDHELLSRTEKLCTRSPHRSAAQAANTAVRLHLLRNVSLRTAVPNKPDTRATATKQPAGNT